MFPPVLHDLDASPRMLGWNHTRADCDARLQAGAMLHLLVETSNRCNQDCEYCYTVDATIGLDDIDFHHSPLPGELTIDERLALIDAAAALGATSYDIVGAGEPFIDPHSMTQVRHAVTRGMQPIIFTNGSVLGSTHGDALIDELWQLGVTVVVKHHGDRAVHDRIVRRPGAAALRDRAIDRLLARGFASSSPTRLGVDNIVYKATLAGVPDVLRWCRQRNIFLVCSSFIPSGRTTKSTEEAASWSELQDVFARCRAIDRDEFGIAHSASMPFLGYGKVCTQYLGLYVTIRGDAYGCVGKSESYGNVRERTLGAMWRQRLPHLEHSFDGGCPPRKAFYERLGIDPTKIAKIF